MASKTVSDEVDARLAANWTRCPVIEANTAGRPPTDDTAFLTVQYPVGNEDHISLGAVGQRTFRESGGIRLVLSVPIGNGKGQALQWADELRALFRAAQFGAVNCRESSPARLDDGNDNGGYFVLTVVIPYYADLLA